MKKILTTCTAMFAVLALFAQSSAGLWSVSNRADFARPAFMPQAWHALSLDLDGMRNHLRSAPMEFTAAARNSPLELMLPMPDGSLQAFSVWESPIMEPALAEQFPMIKTFAGKSVSNPGTTVRLDFSPQGFNAIVHTGEQTILVVPNSPEEQVYLSFWLKDVDFTTPEALQYHCEVEHTESEVGAFTENFISPADRAVVPVDLFTYRLAVATTGEYSADYGNTAATVMANVVTVVSNINSVFERDAAVRLLLIANTSDVFHYTGNDPYTNGNTDMMINQNPPVLNGAFTVNGYDIGHVFGTNGGGLANLAGVCNGEGGISQFPKARGASCKFGPYDGPLFYIIAGHEMGHQFNATHTFNKCDDENETPETGYEPGSGSTMMCYNGNGVCGPNHVQPTSDPFFHINSMLRMQEFTRTGGGNQCKQVVAEGNQMPTSDIPMAGGFYIPKSTPFSLTGVGADVNDPFSSLTYTWEQYDLGPPSILGQPIGTAPLFRWYPPTHNPTRIFPKIETIISNTPDIREVLPTIDRVLTFRFVVRDNHNDGGEAGAFNYDEIQFNCDADSGPFVVTNPNTAVTYTVGEYVEVTWNRANTHLGPVNCQKVNIHLSTDGGYTYPTLLVAQTANDGSAYVVMPNMPTTTARVRVEAADNIFFDISNENFTIVAPAQPTYLLNATPGEGGLACDEIVIDLETESLVGFTGQISFSVSGLPTGAEVNFSANPVAAGQSATMTINTSNVTQFGNVTMTLLATSPGLPDQTRTITFNIVNTDLSGIEANTPVDGASGQETLPIFAWSDLPNADSYDIQIATDPGFTNIVDSGTGLTTNSYTPSITLEDDQVYYWRVRANNLCGTGGFGDPFSFRTVSQTCVEKASAGDQNDINISGSGLPTIKSIINISQAGEISDVNVSRVKGEHSTIRDIQIRLKGPDNTTVVLLSQPSCNGDNFDSGFDDQSPQTLVNCPQTNANYKPVGSLADFIGKNSQGDWTLELEVVDSDGQGGNFDEWTLEICAGLQATNPLIIKNDTLRVPPGQYNLIYSDKLTVTDADNFPSELQFTIVTNTAHGHVELNGQTLGVGDHFTMLDVYSSAVTYTNTNASAVYDYFTFSVNDGEGGYAGTPRFNIVMDPDAVIGATDPVEAGDVRLFPNPATDEVNIVLGKNAGTAVSANLLDVQGRRLLVNTNGLGTDNIQLNTSSVPAGLYFVQVKTAAGTFVKKIVIE